MKLFIDSANINEIKRAFSTYLIDGVTTNPSLAAKENIDFDKLVKEILDIFKNTDNYVSLEVISLKEDEMILEGIKLSKLSKNVIVKLPCTEDGYRACKVLSSKKIRINMTLCFSASQALLAAKAGAFFISPFIGRLDDQGYDGMKLIEEIKKIYDNYKYKTQILVASIRSPRQVAEAALIGADVCTVPYAIFEKLFRHSLTDTGLKTFLDDWYNYKSRLGK
ncbi:MAG TPA: fructose-6-phosphate aldolase [Candidatus Nanoarchaeia archaeon]|nr:fructose-6-phosphate aldolase [Candidatus Nanoarchaeia archaeon]